MVVRCPAFQQSAAAPAGRRRARGRGGRGATLPSLAEPRRRPGGHPDKRDQRAWFQHPAESSSQQGASSRGLGNKQQCQRLPRDSKEAGRKLARLTLSLPAYRAPSSPAWPRSVFFPVKAGPYWPVWVAIH
ncbi:unnamed protein product [Rangifer tarandus platyrhynchus]|uniref:Uncharacterized protein n=2 Tax=Rangifer tarandus platyrhynchus TaxID=3082113 RepID=A0ACB0F7F2_RANTA|nr:unnamed protein product [Rangifer tarandus platyrhynchus]CAI9708900.1 unnamed protein product [Rangifer tarandus platyrhynchus]